jgi:hypothetical protein
MTDKIRDNSIPLTDMELAEQFSAQPAAAATPRALAAESAMISSAKPSSSDNRSHGAWLVWLGNSMALLWLGSTIAYAVGFQNTSQLLDLSTLSYTQLGGLAIFMLAPALLFMMCGLLARQVVRGTQSAHRVDLALQRLSAPASHAEHEVRSLSGAISGEVERINTALESALARLAAMEEVISHHADTLEQSAGDARDRTEILLKGLRSERLRLGEVSESLDDKAALIAAAISDQSKMVAAAAELAATQASDSERRIRVSVDSLEEAGSSIAERGDIVADKLTVRSASLRDLSDGLQDRSESLEAAYQKHCQRLGQAGEALRKEQEKIGSALDFHRAELDVMATTARGGADALNEAASSGAAAFKDAVDAAYDRSNSLAGEVRSVSEHAAREHEAALARLVAAAQEAKQISDAAIEAIEAQADIISSKVERTNEAAFDAARRSDESFDKRISDAEKLTAKASQAADEAAESVSRRLEAVLAAARAETQTVERQITTMTDQLGELPVMARDRAKEAADALRRGLEGLNSAALVAAEEAQEIDAAFQARIRQNYELLSDFMLHMGTVAGGRRTLNLASNELPDPLQRRRREAAETPQTSDTVAASTVEDEAGHTPRPASNTETQADNKVGFPERGGRRTQSDPGWRWKDLLSSMPDDADEDAARSEVRRRQEENED